MRQALGILALVLWAASAQATPTTLDCTNGCDVTDANQPFGLAFWSTAAIQPSGSGVFGPFLRMHNNGTEDGHNTDGDLSNDEMNGVHTASVEMAALDNLVQIGNFAFYEFALDLGEPATKGQNPDPDSVISLDSLKICSADSATLTMADDCPATPITYSLDLLQDRAVLLDYNYLGNGNGGSDLFVYIPYALVHTDKKYFYMYSSFGYQLGYETEGTYEEWAYQSRVGVDPNVICPDGLIQSPCPSIEEVPDAASSLLLMGMGLAGIEQFRRRRKQ